MTRYLNPLRSPALRTLTLALTLAFLVTGCLLPRAAKTPMTSLDFSAPTTPQASPECLVILLPGALDRPEKFDRKGFITLAREMGLNADLMAVDSHLGYFRNRTFPERFREDILAPAQARGYRQIWLVGISLGGFGSLLYTRLDPDAIEGVVAIAPFLGDETVREIRAAGGVRQWQPPSENASRQDRPPQARGREDAARELWQFLKGYETPAEESPTLVVAFGTEDRSVTGHRMLAELLPESQVFTAPGGHDWKAWRELWRQVLAAEMLCVSPAG